MRKIAGYLTKNRSEKDQKIAQSTHENGYIKPRKTFWRNSKQLLRGIAIFLVVFGHITHIAELRNYIWGFHIPIFFFISGLLFKPDKYNSFNDFLRNKIRNLIIPYIIFYLVTLCYYILIESHVRGGVSSLKLLLGMFYGSYYNNFMYFNGALWFLPCLFSMEIVGYTLRNCFELIQE